MQANLENSAVATGLEKLHFYSNPKEGQCKECLNCCTTVLISQASKVIFKIIQARLQQYMNRDLSDVQAGFQRRRGTRDQVGNVEKSRQFQKIIYFFFTDYAKAFHSVDSQQTGKLLKRGEYQNTLPVSWEICKWIKKQQLESDMEQLTGSKLKKEYDKAVYCHPAYLTYMQSISSKMLGWMNHKLESGLPGEISRTSDMQIIPL